MRARPGCAASAHSARRSVSFSAATLHAVLEACVPLEAAGLVVGVERRSGFRRAARAPPRRSAQSFRGAAAARTARRSRAAVRRCRFSRSLRAAVRASCAFRCASSPSAVYARAGLSLEAAARAARYAALEPRSCSRGSVCSRRIIARIRRRHCCCRHCAAPASKACRPCRCAARSGRAGMCARLLDVAHSDLRQFGAHLAHLDVDRSDESTICASTAFICAARSGR